MDGTSPLLHFSGGFMPSKRQYLARGAAILDLFVRPELWPSRPFLWLVRRPGPWPSGRRRRFTDAVMRKLVHAPDSVTEVPGERQGADAVIEGVIKGFSFSSICSTIKAARESSR